jgi:hypothetical protein
MRGRSMVVRGKCSMFAVCCVKPLKFKVQLLSLRIANKVELYSNDPRRSRAMDLCLSRERYR